MSTLQWRQQHSEERRRRSAQWRAANADRVRSANAAWRQDHPDYQRDWVATNRECDRARKRTWAQANPDKVRAQAQRHRARKLSNGAIEVFDDAEIFERDQWVCQVCGSPIDRLLTWPDPMSVSLDHVVALVNGGVHTRANTQSAHLRCNQRKGAR
jgi:hypothetical protein